jgi:hypothetical protein
MIDFDDAHRRYWRDCRNDPDAAIPVRGGDFTVRKGKRYAVLYDADKKLVAAYEVVERLFAVEDAALVEALAAPQPEPLPVHAEPPLRRRLRLRRFG